MIEFSKTLIESRFAVIETSIAAGSGKPYLHLYSGPRPASLGAITTANKLIASIEILKPVFKNKTGTTALINTATESNILEDGSPTWARIVNGSNVPMIDLDIGEGLDLQVNTPVFYKGGRVTISSLILGE